MEKLTSCSMSYALLIYENSKDVCVKNEDIKKMYVTDNERKNATRLAVPKYRLYVNGETDEGRL